MATSVIQSFNYAALAAKSDSVDTPTFEGRLSDALWIGGAGVVNAVFENGSTQLFTVVAGTLLPIKTKRINDASTTATLMIALWQI